MPAPAPTPAAAPPAPPSTAATATTAARDVAVDLAPPVPGLPIAAPQPAPEAAGSAGAAVGAPQTAAFGGANGPRILHLDQPIYPPRALRLRREGKVLLRLEIDAGGVLQSVTVVQAAGYGFEEAALEAVRRARFAPATKGGRPVSCVALLPVSFTLAPRP